MIQFYFSIRIDYNKKVTILLWMNKHTERSSINNNVKTAADALVSAWLSVVLLFTWQISGHFAGHFVFLFVLQHHNTFAITCHTTWADIGYPSQIPVSRFLYIESEVFNDIK